MPCYKYGAYLPGCVESIITQPGVEATVTIVDDASPDDSAEVAARLAEQHRGVKLLRNEKNLGAVNTYNRGLRQADSDYVLLISADDLVAPGALGRAAALMEANPSVGMVYGRAQKFSNQPRLRRPIPAESWTIWKGEDWISLQLHRGWSNIASPEALVRTSVQHAAGYYDPELKHTHDMEMWLRVAALADIGHINGVDQAYYRRHPVSYSTQFSVFQDIEERWTAYSQFLVTWQRTDLAGNLRGVVRRQLADEALFDLLQTMEHDQVDDQTIDAALQLARDIDPDVVERGQWADVAARREGRRPGGLDGLARTGLRELAFRARWHRYRKYRYLG